MRKDYEKAEQLRRRGKSYKEIRKLLGIPIATLSDWFKNQPWSQEIKGKLSLEQSLLNPKKLKLMAEANRKRWQEWHQESQQEAITQFPQLKDNQLFLAGLMLYWGEGDRKLENSVVRLANSDPEMIRIFYMFLKETLNIPQDKISAWILLYPDLIDTVQKNFWSRAAGIPLDRFTKSIYITGKHPTKRMAYGVCNIVVHSRQLKEKIITWIDLCKNHFRSI